MSDTTKYNELDDNQISTRMQLHYFIQKHKITPVKAQRLNLLFGARLVEKANEFSNGLCFRCDSDLEEDNISYTLGHYGHEDGQCPPESYKLIKTIPSWKLRIR